MKFYLIGIKGSGMASLFNLLTDDGYQVVGSDVDNYIYTEESLSKKNAKIYSLSDKSYLNDYFVIIGHDFIDQYLINELRKNKVPYLEYHKFLNFYLDKRKLVCIAGSHGKTTLTSLLAKSGPYSALIGNGLGYYNIDSPYFFLESCEYKNHYHIYNPNFIIITNIDYDHVDYFVTEEEYILSFKTFTNKVYKGLIEYEASKKINNPYLLTFGINNKADFYVKDYEINQQGIKGTLYFQNEKIINFEFNNIYGYPLLMDIIAVLSFHYLEHNDLNLVIKNIQNYQMTNKRFNIINHNNLIIIEDYAHHPTQIKCNYDTLKTIFPNKKLIAIFKPDRPSRLKYFLNDFKSSLSLFDESYILSFNDKQNENLLLKLTDKNIKYIEDIDKFNISNNESIYILMSSKNMDYIKNKIIKSYEEEIYKKG